MSELPTGAKVTVVGAINVDFVVAADRLPGPGETVVGPRMQRFGGGKGANAAVAAARAGAAVALVGAIGDDDTGRTALAELDAEGVDVSGVAADPDRPTGVALIVVDAAGENQIAVGAGANAMLNPDVVREAIADAGPSCVLVSTEISADAVVAAVQSTAEWGLTCVLNPAPVTPAVLSVLGLGPILTPNRGELSDLAAACPELDGEASVAAEARRVVARTEAPVVVTLGSDGALLVWPDGTSEHLRAPEVEVRDTTGAGDTFNGLFATHLSAGDSLTDAVRAAVAAASLATEQVGARSVLPAVAVTGVR